ncbi:MAG: carbon storage regulator [Acidimicrobiales bacterium]|jgi:carbon storage regulator CsrA
MALVLKRNLGQGIKLGDNVYVEILKISGRSVSLRIVAPQEVRVSRFELPPLAKRVRRWRGNRRSTSITKGELK